MKNIIYLFIVLVVLIAGIVSFVLVSNEDKDIMTSITDMFEDPSSIVSEIEVVDFEKMNSMAHAITDSMQDTMTKSIDTMSKVSTYIPSSVPSVLKDSTSAIYKNGHFALGHKDGSLEVVNSNGDSKKLSFHTKRINNLYIVKNKLMASSDDGSLSVINLDTLSLIKQLKGHGKEVEGIVAFENLVFSISRDRTIKVWEIDEAGLVGIIEY